MLGWFFLQCLSLLVQLSSARMMEVLKDDQSNVPLHIVGNNRCWKDEVLLQYQPKQIVSASLYSFGLFTESKDFSLGITVAISCEDKTSYKLLTLADWNLTVNCRDHNLLFGQDSYHIQENTLYSLQLVVHDSRLTMMKIGATFMRPVKSSKFTDDTKLVIAPEVVTLKNFTVYQLTVNTGDWQKMEPRILVEIHIDPILRVNEEAVINVTFAEADTGKRVFPRYKVSVPGIAESSVPCKEGQCRVTFPVSGVFLCRLVYFIGGQTYQKSRNIIVRKVGDNASLIETQFSPLSNANGLRPLDRTTYRSQIGLTIARSLNWSQEYYFGTDSVSERLFDYRILDNKENIDMFKVLRCEDVFLAGGPRIRASDDSTSGLGKRVLFVPMKYPDGTDMSTFILKRRPIENIVNRHASPYGCSKVEVENLIEYAGMHDMINQQLIRDSYGHLSLDMNPSISEDVVIESGIDPAPSPTRILSESLEKAGKAYSTDNRPIWARVALAPFPLRPYMPAFKVWYKAPRDIVMTSACSISTYHMIHEISHMLGYHHPDQYRVKRPAGGNIISPLDQSGEWIGDNGYQESFDALGCCSGDASLSTRILNGWLNWEGSRLEYFPGPHTTRKDFILHPFDSPETSKGRSHMAVVVRMNQSQILVCGYRDLVRWPVSFDNGEASLATRNNMRGIECELLQSTGERIGQWDTLRRTTLDFSLLKEDVFHEYRGEAFHQRKIFSLLGEQMAFHAPQHKLLIVLKGLVPCNGSMQTHGHGIIKNYMGLRDDYPFQENVSSRATYTIESRDCAAVHMTYGDPPSKELNKAMPIQFLVSSDETGETYLYIQWNPDELQMAGVSVKTKSNETIQSFISHDDLVLNPPLKGAWLSDPCLATKDHYQYRIDMIDYTGRSSSSQIRYLASHTIDISTRFSNNHDAVEYTHHHSLPIPRGKKKECTVSHSQDHTLHVFIAILILLYL